MNVVIWRKKVYLLYIFSIHLFFQKLAKFTVFCMFTLPVIVVIALTAGEDAIPALNICLGQTEVNVLNFHRVFACQGNNWIENVLCHIILYIYIITSCNLVEMFFLWNTYKQIKKATESAKTMIGRKDHQKRKKYASKIIFSKYTQTSI